MRCKSLVLASMFLTVSAYAKEPKAYQSGKVVLQMDLRCGVELQDAEKFC